MKTYMAHANDVVRKWYVVDAEGIALGRLASKVAATLLSRILIALFNFFSSSRSSWFKTNAIRTPSITS